MITGAPTNILDYGADPTGVLDSTAAIQAAIAAGDCIYCPAGTYLLSGRLDVFDKTFYGDGYAQTIFETNMPSSVYAAITFGKLGWTSASDTTSGGILHGFTVKRKVNTNYVIGVMVTGCHNGTVDNVKTQECLIGFYVENTSELYMTQCLDVASNWSYVFDNRGSRTTAQRPGGFTGNGNDVSSCTMNMLTSAFSQQNSMLFINCGTMNLTGATITVFADNPSFNPNDMPYGLPLSIYGIHVYGSPTGNFTRNSNITGVVFEADQGRGNARTCIRFYSPTPSSAPISNVTIDSCEVQTYSAYIADNDCTTFIDSYGYGPNINIAVSNSGFSPNASSVNTFFTGKLFNMLGESNITCNNVYPLNALSISALTSGFKYRQMNVELLYEMPIYALTPGAGSLPAGWAGTGAFSTKIVKVDDGSFTPASLNFNGGSGAVAMGRSFSFAERMYDPMSITVIMIYAGDELTWDWTVNSQGDTLLSIKSDINAARYGNTLYGNITNSNDYRIRFLSFPAFSAVTAFKTMFIELGVNSSNAAFSSKLYYFGVGYIPNYSDNNMFS
jgi:hypothetical protein